MGLERSLLRKYVSSSCSKDALLNVPLKTISVNGMNEGPCNNYTLLELMTSSYFPSRKSSFILFFDIFERLRERESERERGIMLITETYVISYMYM